jgi:hypothetical protein
MQLTPFLKEHPPLTLPDKLHNPPTRFATSFAYYGLVMDLQGFGVSIYLIQVIFGAVDLPAKFVCFFVINSLGRRPAQMASLLLAGICILVNAVIPKGEHGPSFSASSIDTTQLLRRKRDQFLQALTPKLLLSPSFLSRADNCPYLPCCAGEGLSGCLLQLHLPVHRGAVPHNDPVSGSLVGEEYGERYSLAHIKVRPLSTVQYPTLISARHVGAIHYIFHGLTNPGVAAHPLLTLQEDLKRSRHWSKVGNQRGASQRQ